MKNKHIGLRLGVAFAVLIVICLALAILIFKADRASSRETKPKRPSQDASTPTAIIRKDVVSMKDARETL